MSGGQTWIISGSYPRLKLADFGFAQKFFNDQTKTALRGSPLYMAPEMILKKRYDAKVDLWSTGVILYECLFGKAPYKSTTVDELMSKIAEDAAIVVPDSPSISENCHDLLTRCLTRDPSHRISYEEFFQHGFLDLEHMPSDQVRSLSYQLLNMLFFQSHIQPHIFVRMLPSLIEDIVLFRFHDHSMRPCKDLLWRLRSP